MKSAAGRTNRSLLRTVVMLVLLAQSAVIVLFWAWLFFAPHAVERTEVPTLINVLWWKSGSAPYTLPESFPLIQNPYGPVFQWLCKVLPTFDGQPYATGRALSLLSMIGIVVGMAIWLRRQRVPWPAVALGAMLAFGSKPWILFGPLYRVDALAVLLSFVGLLLIVHFRSRPVLAAALVLFGAAISVKLTAIAAPAAAILFLWTIDRRRAIALAAGAALVMSTCVLVVQWLTDGAYLFNASFGNEPTHVLQALGMPARVLLSVFWLIAIATVVRGVGVARGSVESAAALYAVVSLGTAAVFSLNPLASWNYLLEVYVALGLLTASLMAGLWEGSIVGDRLSRASVFLAVHAVLALAVTLQVVASTSEEILDYRARYEAAHERLEPLVRAGRTVLILDSLAGKDALAALGRPNALSMPAALEARPEIQSLVRRLAPESDYELILSGDRLAPWTGRPGDVNQGQPGGP